MLTPTLGYRGHDQVQTAATTATAAGPLAASVAPMAPEPVDVGALLMTFAIGAQTAGVRSKASRGRTAFANLVQQASGAAAALRELGGDASALEEAIRCVGAASPDERR